ncbi:MAG: sulfatase family protein [Thiogranum sp.]
MDRKTFLKQAGLALTAASVAPGILIAGDKKWRQLLDGNAKGKRPNIFIYVADDQYIGSVGCYGAEPSYTPNIDKLASQGMRFTRCYTPSSICSPNRGVLLSGQYPLKNGVHPNHSGYFDGIKSLPNYMKELGYRAIISGKDGIQKPSDLYEWEFRISKTDKHVPGADEPRHDRHRISDLAAIEAMVSAQDDRPFCHFHAASLPHGPLLNKSLNGLEGYDANNFYMDYELGQMLDILEKHGKADNTIVIYVNDNEAQLPRTKNTLYETGTRVPMVVRWPGVVDAGVTTDAMVSFTDFIPTLLEIAGGETPEVVDGKSMLPVWRRETDKHHGELYFSFSGVIVSRSGRQETPYPIRAIRTERYRYIRYINHTVPAPKGGKMNPYEELFDLVNDPGEQVNLAENPGFAAVKAELADKVDTWMVACDDQGIESELATLRKYPPYKKT